MRHLWSLTSEPGTELLGCCWSENVSAEWVDLSVVAIVLLRKVSQI